MYMIQTQLSYLPSSTDVRIEFPKWICQYCNSESAVLDVGAGKGRTGHALAIKPNVARLVGVDPDASIEENPYLDERYQASIEAFAKEYDSNFDCLYSTSVLEHVTQPGEFLAACRSLLKPGGMLFSVTPNLWHYFGLTTRASASVGIEDWLLERLVGVQLKASYHFPTAYRLNNLRTLKSRLASAGFREVEFKFFDPPEDFKYVFPRPLRWFPGCYSRLVYTLRLPQIMGLIMLRATA